jgi:ferredoxin-NADP reductase
MVYEDLRIPITVKAVVAETSGYLSLYFVRPRDFVFNSGDWMDINLMSDQPPGGTTYSFASSPTESELRITFRSGASPFKKSLENLKPGDKLVVTEFGNDYAFQLKEHKASVLIAGGVGVTPFRSMIKQMVDEGSKNTVQLIYFNTSPSFLYKDEFDDWQQRLQSFQADFIATKDLKRKDRERLLNDLISDVDRQYYVSGPSGMVGSTVRLLETLSVDKRNIKIDDFGF